MKRSPYVVGQWVRGLRFYGRQQPLAELLDPRKRGVSWLVGLRRIGKTSLLRELERLAGSSPTPGRIPLYWDLEDVEDEESLAEGLVDALWDAETELERLGLELRELEARDPDEALPWLIAQGESKGLGLLLLWDETEALATLTRGALRRLVDALAVSGTLRVIAASGPRLTSGDGHTSEDGRTSGDGHTSSENNLGELLAALCVGRSMPLEKLLLGPMSRYEAAALARQDQLPPERRPGLTSAQVEEICDFTGGHPYLTQMLAKHSVERRGDVSAGWLDLAADRSLSFFHQADFDLLDGGQQRLLLQLLEDGEVQGDSERVRAAYLATLESLGVLSRRGAAWTFGNASLAAWMRACF